MKDKIEYKCPHCESYRLVRVRHDSDWGGSNAQYLLNDKKFYEADDIGEEFGDIECNFCFACSKFSDSDLAIKSEI